MPVYTFKGCEMEMTEDQYAESMENQRREQKVIDAFKSVFESKKITNSNLRSTYRSEKISLTVTGMVMIAYCDGRDKDGYVKQYFDSGMEGYQDILNDLTVTDAYIGIIRKRGLGKEDNLIQAQKGVEEIRNEVRRQIALLSDLRTTILEH